jgi:hypothetical protein
LVSCRNESPEDTDGRRLAWHLIQAVQNDSWLCKQAAKNWFKRLYQDYNVTENGMRETAKKYYNPKGENPFSKYWVD